MEKTLAEVREEIDSVDDRIKSCFKERMELANQVAIVKSRTSDEIFKPEREAQIIEKLTGDVSDDIKMEYRALVRRIMEISRKYQYGRTMELREGLAHPFLTEVKPPEKVAMIKTELYICDMISKDCVDTYDTYDEIAAAVTSGEADAGIGIAEEVSRGVSNRLHGMLAAEALYINRCHVVTDDGIRKKVVQFSKDFVVRETDNRMKIMFVCPNRSGSLAGILSMVSDYGINFTEIHSRPNRQTEWNYEFYAELEANYMDKAVQALVFQLENETEIFKILGSYHCEGDFV